MRQILFCAAVLLCVAGPALAGPPFVSDDPEPTDFRHYEIYLYTEGADNRLGSEGSFGIDFNFGATPELQLTAVLPLAYAAPERGTGALGIGNVELAAKYRVLHQSEIGWDLAVFPRVFLPSGSALVGERNASLLLPLWVGRDWGKWSTFGGGGCVLQGGRDSHDYCLMGWAVTRQVLPELQLGIEVTHEGAPSRDGRAMSGIGAGLKYDLSAHYHLLAYAGPGLQNAGETQRLAWYSSVLFTF
ncbi:MAG: transporter [Alphaproteobacteria bacterium]|nr:transporter [Alphaproteobacteria bacterium]